MKISFCLVLFITVIPVRAQFIKTRLDFAGGVSAREYFHGGIRYQYADFVQAGIYYGSDLGIKTADISTICIDNMIHFGKNSYTTNRPVWYVRQGYTHSKNDEIGTDRVYKYSYLDLSAGREFGISDWLGFNIDMGVILQLREKTEFKIENRDSAYKNSWFWLPLFRAQIFISL